MPKDMLKELIKSWSHEEAASPACGLALIAALIIVLIIAA